MRFTFFFLRFLKIIIFFLQTNRKENFTILWREGFFCNYLVHACDMDDWKNLQRIINLKLVIDKLNLTMYKVFCMFQKMLRNIFLYYVAVYNKNNNNYTSSSLWLILINFSIYACVFFLFNDFFIFYGNGKIISNVRPKMIISLNLEKCSCDFYDFPKPFTIFSPLNSL
jgi:hypothetical protein